MPTTANPSAGSFTLADLSATISILGDGDAVNQNNLYKEASPGGTPNLTLMRLANLLAMVGAAPFPKAATSYTRVASGSPLWDLGKWNASFAGGTFPGWASVTGSTGYPIAWPISPLDVPNGSTLTAISWEVTGPAGHSAFPAGQPANMPYIYLAKAKKDGTGSISAQFFDPSASVATYEALHTLTLSGLSEVIDRSTYAYFAVFVSESGLNAISSTSTTVCVPTFTYTGAGVPLF